MGSDGFNSGLSRRAVISASVASLAALMFRAAPSDAAAKERSAADPRHAFTERLAALVVPDTSTPGAAKTKVASFVLLALDQGMGGMSPALLERVRKQLDEAAGQDFAKVSAERGAQLLAAFDRSAFAAVSPAADSAESAWRHIKSAIVAGYYTSEIGASKELVYEPVPGKFENVMLTPDFRSRSNDGFGGSL